MLSYVKALTTHNSVSALDGIQDSLRGNKEWRTKVLRYNLLIVKEFIKERIYAIPTKKRNNLITLVVDNLEKRALIKRVRSSEDRRSVSVTLTKDGRRVIESIFPRHVGSTVAEFEVLNSGDQEALRHLYRKIWKQERS